jgi:hypothetical protein
MKQLHVRHQTSVADPLRPERLRRALAIIMDYQKDYHASRPVRSRLNSQSTTRRDDSQSVQSLHLYIHQHGWSLLPTHGQCYSGNASLLVKL